MKKVTAIYIIMVCFVIALSGCSGSYEGKEIVDKAKRLHTELEAAHIAVREYVRDENERGDGSDLVNSPVVQEIWYRFAGDVMQYMYIGRDADTGEEWYEFNNGTELDTWKTGDTEWSGIAKGSEGYYGYSRAKRHYFADGDLLLDDHAAAVKSAKVQYEPGEVTAVMIEYDDAKIAQYEQMSGVTGYKQKYMTDIITDGSGVIVDRGFCYSMFVSYSKDGKDYSYWIDIEKRDPGEPIERAGLPAISGETAENGQ